jgi:hypothetical protein
MIESVALAAMLPHRQHLTLPQALEPDVKSAIFLLDLISNIQ